MSRSPSRYNAANLLSGFRLGAAPVLAALALFGAREAFTYLLAAALLTDALDGFVARTFNLRTEFGARLDSQADILTYGAALIGLFAFEYPALEPHLAELVLFICLLAVSALAPLVKFGRTASYHLYLFKATAVVQTFAVLWLFFVGFHASIYYIGLGFGIVACLEDIAVTILLRRPVSDAKSLYTQWRAQQALGA